MRRGWLLCLCLVSVAAPAATLRAALVPIVAQEGFLEQVLAPFLAAQGLTLEVHATHGREVARAARAGTVDLVVMHTRFPGRARLIDDRVIDTSTAVFANPIALLAPRADPANALAAPGMAEAMRRIRAAGTCVLENHLEGLVALTRRLVGDGCLQQDRGAVGLGAVLLASRHGWYTLWGLHPFAMSEPLLRAQVWQEPDLLRPLEAAAVTGAPGAAQARAAIAWLQQPAARAAMRAFRLQRAPAVQAWYPVE